MLPLLAIGRSMRRSHARRAVLVALDRLGQAGLAPLAEQAGLAPERVRAVLHGRLPGFLPELSLLALELVRQEGEEYAIAPRGRLVVRSLARGGLKLLLEGPDAALRAPLEAAHEERCPACGQRVPPRDRRPQRR